jgi:hypothetical protein
MAGDDDHLAQTGARDAIPDLQPGPDRGVPVERQRSRKSDMFVGLTDLLHRQEGGGRALWKGRRAAFDHGVGDQRIDPHRQVRPMLFDGRDRQNSDPVAGIRIGKIARRHLAPVASGSGHVAPPECLNPQANGIGRRASSAKRDLSPGVGSETRPSPWRSPRPYRRKAFRTQRTSTARPRSRRFSNEPYTFDLAQIIHRQRQGQRHDTPLPVPGVAAAIPHRGVKQRRVNTAMNQSLVGCPNAPAQGSSTRAQPSRQPVNSKPRCA